MPINRCTDFTSTAYSLAHPYKEKQREEEILLSLKIAKKNLRNIPHGLHENFVKKSLSNDHAGLHLIYNFKSIREKIDSGDLEIFQHQKP